MLPFEGGSRFIQWHCDCFFEGMIARLFGTLLLAATATLLLLPALVENFGNFVLNAVTAAVATAFTMRAARNMSAAVYKDLAQRNSDLTHENTALESGNMAWLLKGRTAVGRLFGRARRPEQPETTAPDVTIVRGGLSPEYYFFVDIFAKQNGLEVIVDRRVDDRRRRPGYVLADRRSNDRRGPPPPTWARADIVMPSRLHERKADAPIKPQLVLVPPPRH